MGSLHIFDVTIVRFEFKYHYHMMIMFSNVHLATRPVAHACTFALCVKRG